MADSKELPKGSGSLWNPNNWHWEQKNYNEVAKKLLCDRLAPLVFERDGVKFMVTKPPKVTGHAELSIRKGKTIAIFELAADVDWRAESDVDECEGSAKLNDINESDFDFTVDDITAKGEGDFPKKAKTLVKKFLKDEVINSIRDLRNDLIAFEADPQKIEESKRKKQETDAMYFKVVQEKAQEKDKLLEEQMRIDQENAKNKLA